MQSIFFWICSLSFQDEEFVRRTHTHTHALEVSPLILWEVDVHAQTETGLGFELGFSDCKCPLASLTKQKFTGRDGIACIHRISGRVKKQTSGRTGTRTAPVSKNYFVASEGVTPTIIILLCSWLRRRFLEESRHPICLFAHVLTFGRRE